MTFAIFLTKFSWLDWIGLIWFLVCWFGYEQVVERGWIGRTTLHEETHKLRLGWGRVMLTRSPRIVDAALIGNLLPSLSFYANTTIYIIAALFAALGTLDQLMTAASELPFSRVFSREATELKLLILLGVFVITTYLLPGSCAIGAAWGGPSLDLYGLAPGPDGYYGEIRQTPGIAYVHQRQLSVSWDNQCVSLEARVR